MLPDSLQQHLEKAFDQRDHESGSGINVFVLIELGDFKRLSSSLGVATTELLVAAFRERVRQFLRGSDLLFEVSEDRCGVVLVGIESVAHLDLAAAGLFRQFEEPLAVIDQNIKANVFAGFAVPTKAQTNATTMLDYAEIALGEARSSTRHFAITKVGAAEACAGDADWELKQSFVRGFENGEQLLHFEPKAHASYRSIIGAAASLHWKPPSGGTIACATLLPHLADDEIMRDVATFCIRSAAAALRTWPPELHVAVPIQGELLVDGHVAHIVRDALGFFDLAAERLTVQIPSIPTHDLVLATLAELRDSGIGIAIDDFGSGPISFADLMRIPATELIVDARKFDPTESDGRAAALIESFTALARKFDIKVAAKHVGDLELADALRDLGCDSLQGAQFGAPLEQKQFATFLAG